jgi:hypothetical protein
MPEEVRREFWIHEPTATVWAVEHAEGAILGVAGPISAADADPVLLDHLPYLSTEAVWVTLNRDEFRPLRP